MLHGRLHTHTGRSDRLGSAAGLQELFLEEMAAGPTAGEMPDLCDELCCLSDTAAFEDFLACVAARSNLYRE